MIAGAGEALSRALIKTLALAGLVIVSACSDSGDGGSASGSCVPRETRECKAVSGCTGVQQCNADGLSFSECICATGATGGSSGSAGTSSVPGSGGTQSQGGSAGLDNNSAGSTGHVGGAEAQGGTTSAGGSAHGGTAGDTSGAGNSSMGGTTSNGGTAGNAGAPSAGTGGSSGSAGTSASGGSAGSTASGGNAGSTSNGGAGGSPASGGNAGLGGNGGTGGVPQKVGCTTPGVIDDFEDGDNVLCLHDGRSGKWRLDHDESPAGQQSPDPFLPTADPPTGDGNDFFAYTKGSGFAVWGGGISVALNQPNAALKAYDASKYAGIKFRAKSKAPMRLSAGFETVQTLPVADGGTCVDTCGGVPGPDCTFCYEPFRKIVDVGTEWKTYHVPFVHLRQGTRTPQTFDARQLMTAGFVAIESSFEFWIDDIAFYTGEPVKFGCGDPKIIDDFEDGDTRVCAHDGRVGLWSNSNDGTGVQEPNPFASSHETRPGDGGDFAAHTTGKAFSNWGGGVFLTLNQPLVADAGKPYDAHKYAGFSFDAVSTQAGDLLVGFQTTQTTPAEFGGQCQQTCTGTVTPDCTECFLAFHKLVRVGPAWQRYYVSFEQLRQIFKTTQTFESTKLLTMLFTSPNANFDFWVDNVKFYSPGEVSLGCSNEAIIDDFEDGNAQICAHDGRTGSWSMDNDGTGTQGPLPLLPSFGRRGTSDYSLHTSGENFMTWGGGVSLGLNRPSQSSVFLAYDAGGYQGVKLWARAPVATPLMVGFHTKQTVTPDIGGICDDECDPEIDIMCEPCFASFNEVINLGTSWKEYTIPFSAFQQTVTSSQTFELNELLYMTFVVLDQSFEFQIDDVRFY